MATSRQREASLRVKRTVASLSKHFTLEHSSHVIPYAIPMALRSWSHAMKLHKVHVLKSITEYITSMYKNLHTQYFRTKVNIMHLKDWLPYSISLWARVRARG